ncbi:MAG: efflux transporter outer membrane subunit [Bacteroidota bacterium]|nr:efflux transporter outer membrane subunit [Bacteroidota bacterium]
MMVILIKPDFSWKVHYPSADEATGQTPRGSGVVIARNSGAVEAVGLNEFARCGAIAGGSNAPKGAYCLTFRCRSAVAAQGTSKPIAAKHLSMATAGLEAGSGIGPVPPSEEALLRISESPARGRRFALASHEAGCRTDPARRRNGSNQALDGYFLYCGVVASLPVRMTPSVALFRSARPVLQLARRFLAAGVIATTLLAGCSMAPRLADPDIPLPERFAAATIAEPATQQYWWHGFGDAELNALVDSVIVRNLDLRVAIARVAELQGRYRITRAGQFPSAQLSIQRDQLDTPSNTGIGGQLSDRVSVPGGPGFPDRFEYTVYNASLSFAYELDFWGRLRGANRAALQEFYATQSDVRTALLGVIGETIAAYFEIAAHQRTLGLMRQHTEVLIERAEVTLNRYTRGLVPVSALYAAQQERDVTLAELPLLESRLEIARGRLALLLGQPLVPADSVLLPERTRSFALEDIPAGLPSDLLRERPDVAAAFQRMESARERVGAARAARFPSFSLTGAAGTQSSTLSEIIQPDQIFWQLGTGLLAPIFNAATHKANVRAAWAQYEQMALRYEKTVLAAFRDVENTLVTYANLRKRHALLDAALEAARASMENRQRQYLRGAGDYLELLGARRNLLQSETALVASKRALADARLAVHRSLGGAWIDARGQSAQGGP